jgi:Ser/Thr protein kinase RdoA (MazF antagonist)
VPTVLDAWWPGMREVDVRPLAGTGLSGVPLFLVRPAGDGEAFVLKAFAAGTSWDRARWVHGLVRHLTAHGIDAVPPVVAARDGETVVTDHEGTLWEAVRFVTGAAHEVPTAKQAAAALATLAGLHRAAESLPGVDSGSGPAPAVVRRIEQARRLRDLPWHVRRAEVAADRRDTVAAFLARWDRAIDAFAACRGGRAVDAIAASAVPSVRVQPVLRDVWSEHVLFANADPERVAGIVDFHAAGVDTPATDLSRLLGSWRPPALEPRESLVERWPEALAAYEAVRPLDAAERRLIPFLHASAIVLGLDNWFRWTIEEGRRFGDARAALARIERLSAELPAALEWLADRPPNCV